MTPATIRELIERHRGHFAQRDATALAEDHARDGVLDSPAHGEVRGREAIEQIYRYWLEAFPDLEFDFDEVLVDGHHVAIFWTFGGTQQGPFFGLTGKGMRVEMTGAGLYAIGEEGIERARHIFDFTGVLVKAGVLKVKGM